jgi:hypothetical protein
MVGQYLLHKLVIITILSLHPHIDFPSGVLIKILYAFLNFPLHIACAFYVILLDLVTVIITGDEHKLLNFS